MEHIKKSYDAQTAGQIKKQPFSYKIRIALKLFYPFR